MFLKYLLHRKGETKVTQGRDGDGLSHRTTEALSQYSLLLPLLEFIHLCCSALPQPAEIQLLQTPSSKEEALQSPSEPQVIQLRRAASASGALLRRAPPSSRRSLLPAGT